MYKIFKQTSTTKTRCAMEIYVEEHEVRLVVVPKKKSGPLRLYIEDVEISGRLVSHNIKMEWLPGSDKNPRGTQRILGVLKANGLGDKYTSDYVAIELSGSKSKVFLIDQEVENIKMFFEGAVDEVAAGQ